MNNKALSSRVIGLDVLKFICCFLVVCIHVDLPEAIDRFIDPISRIAVPIFFIITGFFYEKTCQNKGAGNQLKKIARLVIVANVIHLLWGVCKLLISGDSVVEYFRSLISPSKLVAFFLCNQPPYRVSIWYINAIFYVLVLVFVLQRCGLKSLKKLYPLIPVLLFGNLLIGTYAPLLLRSEIPLYWSRNFLFVGLPYFLLGDFLAHREINIKNSRLLLYMGISCVVSLTEFLLLDNSGYLFCQEHWLGTTVFAVTVFLWFYKNGELFDRSEFWTCIAGWGRKYSFSIYVTHSILIEVWSKLVDKLTPYLGNVVSVLAYISPFAILFASLLIAVVVDRSKKRLTGILSKN